MSHKTRSLRRSVKTQYLLDIDEIHDSPSIELESYPKHNARSKKGTLTVTNPHKLNDKQQVIFDRMLNYQTKMVMLDCLWGTGKTYLAVLAALTLLASKKIEKIYYIRTPKESSNTATIGYLPGDAGQKMQSYNIVLEEKLEEMLPKDQIKHLFEDKIIECLPPGFIRGRSFRNSVLICDEASNFSWEDILLIASRLGENSRMFLIGDSFQNDIGKKTGFTKFINHFNDNESQENGVFYYEMKEKNDVVRSGFVRFLMDKLNACCTVYP